MGENNLQVQGRNVGPVQQLKLTLENVNVKQRFESILGKKSAAFMSSIVNVVNGSDQLKRSDPNSIIGAAFVAATLDLPIDPSLGFAAIVPYGGSAQFQIMYKGLVQLAIRTGLYRDMNCTEVYEDELVEYNPIRGVCRFVDDFSKTKQRENGEEDKIVGFYAWFELKTGFVKELYMTREQVDNHAKKYSKSYQYDLNKGKRTSRWSEDFNAMGRKTVLKTLLSKWGVLSVEMQNAIVNDQGVFTSLDNSSYADNPATASERIADDVEDPFAKEDVVETVQEEPEEIDITK